MFWFPIQKFCLWRNILLFRYCQMQNIMQLVASLIYTFINLQNLRNFLNFSQKLMKQWPHFALYILTKNYHERTFNCKWSYRLSDFHLNVFHTDKLNVSQNWIPLLARPLSLKLEVITLTSSCSFIVRTIAKVICRYLRNILSNLGSKPTTIKDLLFYYILNRSGVSLF